MTHRDSTAPFWLRAACANSDAICRMSRKRPAARMARRVTVRHLLTHTSGLPPFKEYWRASKIKQDTLDKIFAEPLDYQPGTKEVYQIWESF